MNKELKKHGVRVTRFSGPNSTRNNVLLGVAGVGFLWLLFRSAGSIVNEVVSNVAYSFQRISNFSFSLDDFIPTVVFNLEYQITNNNNFDISGLSYQGKLYYNNNHIGDISPDNQFNLTQGQTVSATVPISVNLVTLPTAIRDVFNSLRNGNINLSFDIRDGSFRHNRLSNNIWITVPDQRVSLIPS